MYKLRNMVLEFLDEYKLYSGWREEHYNTIVSFLKYLNSRTDRFILKGGTSLLLCYGLSRFSEDIDLDSEKGNIKNIVNSYCKDKGYRNREVKNTKLVSRYMLDYGGSKDLKIEVSRRSRYITGVQNVNGINTYNIDEITNQKIDAFLGRDKLRDLYDLVFIGNNYEKEMTIETKDRLYNTIRMKGLEQYDYLIKQQEDELIDKDELGYDLLRLYERI